MATTDDPCDDLSAHDALAADPSWTGRVDPDVPPGPLSRAGAARLGRGRGPAGRGRGRRHRRVRRVRPRARVAPAVLRRARRGLGRPQPRGRAHRPARPRRRGAHLPRGAGRRGDGGRDHRVPPPHAAGDGADVVRGRARDDPAPGRPPRPSPADAGPLRTRHGLRRPAARRVHGRAAAAARALRHAPGLPPGRVHARRDRVVARARAAGRLLSLPVRRRAVVVPRRAGVDPALPPCRDRVRRASRARRASSTTRARSARSRPATTCRAAWTPAGSPSWSPSTAWTRTRPSKSRSISRRAVRPRSSSCEAVARRPRGTAGSPRAPRARQLLPRARGVVHRPTRRDEWGIAAFTGRSSHGRGRRPQRPGRALHADLARRRPRSLRGRRQPGARPHGRRARGVAAATSRIRRWPP